MRRWLPVVALFLVLGGVLARTAWMSDDALITLRAAVHWQDGWGPRWNVLERVQVYTHPLWFLILSAVTAVTREYWVTVMALGAICSLGAAGLGAWRLGRPGASAAFLAILVSSTAWIDFATSGLENPLGYLLVLALASARSGRAAAALAGLVLWTRLDLALLALPLLAERRWPGRREAAMRLALLASPALLWMLASTWYYGSPLPNTYYAKLGTAVPLEIRWDAGLESLWYSLQGDPVATIALLTAIYLGLQRRRLGTLGLILYPLYWVNAGGDFMVGRFLAVPVTLAAFWASDALPRRVRPVGLAVVGALVLGLAGRGPNLFSGPRYSRAYPPDHLGSYRLVDERSWYYYRTGWLAEGREPYPAPSREPASPDFCLEEVRPGRQIGLPGWILGPRVHIVDSFGLGDPYLARRPRHSGQEFRPGHQSRWVSDLYVESHLNGRIQLEDPEDRALLEKVWLATRAPMNAPGRGAAVLALLLGSRHHWVDVSEGYEGSRQPGCEPAVRARRLPLWGGFNDLSGGPLSSGPRRRLRRGSPR